MTCCVCGKSGNDLVECKCTLTTKINKYCLECLNAGRESYEDLLAYGWEFKSFTKTYRQRILLPTLTFKNKSIEQFNNEVKKIQEENNET